nr:unnamed protein product [Callosobruchus analis]
MDAKETTCYMNTVQLSKELNIKNKICADPRSSYPDQNRIKTEPSTGEWNESALPMSSTMVKDDTDASTLHTEFDVKNEVDTSTYADVTKNETQRKGKQVVADKKTDGDMFVCYHCECAARSKYHLIDHMSEHTDSKNIYSCYYCDFRTNSRILFATHTRTHSSESTQFEAIYIKEEDADHFKLANGTHSVVKHQDIASNPELRRLKTHPDFIASVSRKIHGCTQCAYKTVSTNYLKRHMGSHRNKAEYRLTHKCIYCNKTLSSKQALDDHILNRHPDFIASVSRKVHKCAECTYKTVFISQLRGHMAKHPDAAHNYITNRCIYCSKTFTSTQSLDDHIIKTHPDFIASVSRKVHECTECTYKSTSNGNLKRHMVKHLNAAGNHTTARCIYCNITFVQKQTLDDHIVKTHPDFIASVNTKIHECTQGTYKTTIPKDIREHLMSKHTEIADNHIFNRCIYCNNTFTSKPSLDDHIVKRHPDFIASVSRKIHECTNCTFKTVRLSRLKEHIKVKHPDTASDRIINNCIYCNKTFVHKRTLNDHIVKTHPDFAASVNRKIFECTECTYKTVSTNDLKRHMMVKHPDIAGGRITVRCSYCNKTFISKSSLDDHILKTHPDFIASVSRKVHECTECTYKTVFTSQLRRHMVKHPDIAGNYTTIRCSYCNKTFESKRSLDNHIVKRHPDFVASVSSKIHGCTQCTYRTTISRCLKEHLMVKHPEVAGNRIFIRCIYCNKSFTRKLALDDHIVKRHPDFIASVSNKIYECSTCTFRTVSTKDLKRYTTAKHPAIAGNRKFRRCIYCNKTFVRRETLDDHIIKTHPDFVAYVSRKVHECTQCTYKTTNISHLKQHLLVKHPEIAGNRIFRCIYCNKTFTRKLALDDHIVKKHSDFIACISNKVHGCTKCTYKTTSNSHLKRHMVKHSDIAGDHITNRCTHCNKTFTSTQALDDHIVKRHPDFIASVSRKVHECTECTYKTVFSSQLRRHMAKHPNIADDRITNRCSCCNKTFVRKETLDDHIVKMVKHPDIGSNRITNKCIHCNKTFTSKQAVDDHIIKTHPDFTASVSSKVHECTECTYKTTSNSHLKRHMAKHTDIAGI